MTTISNAINNKLQPGFSVGETSVTSTGTQLNYVNTATGVTGSANVVLSTSPTLTTPILGQASATNVTMGYVTTVSSGTPIVLVVGSAYQQYITGSTAQTVTMPVTSTLALGQSWLIVNDSSATTTVNSSGGDLIVSLPAGSQGTITCILLTGTTAASWANDFVSNIAGVSSITGTDNQVIASASTGAVTLSLPQSIATTSTPTFTGIKMPNVSYFYSDTNVPFMGFTSQSSASVNYIFTSSSDTGVPVLLEATGTDTNVILNLQGRGNGGVQVQGNTAGGDASAGYVGEFISANVPLASKISVTSAVVTNITSISLTAGDWDVYGNFGISANVANNCQGWVSSTSATAPDRSLVTMLIPTSLAFTDYVAAVHTTRFSLSSTTTIYLSGVVGFSSGSGFLYGYISARRVR